jgi:hypothetical protein
MSQGFIFVAFPEDRAVFAGALQIGRTNQLLTVEGDILEISLGGERDHLPLTHPVTVSVTSAENPELIVFRKAPPINPWQVPYHRGFGSKPGEGPGMAPHGGGPGY